MGSLKFVSTLALVSLAFFNMVVALPYNSHNSSIQSSRQHYDNQTVTFSSTPTRITTLTTTGTYPENSPTVTPKSLFRSKSISNSTFTTSAPTATSASAPASSSSSSKYPPLHYSVVKNYFGTSFFDQFNFYTGEDPTHGFVEYLSFKFLVLMAVLWMKQRQNFPI